MWFLFLWWLVGVFGVVCLFLFSCGGGVFIVLLGGLGCVVLVCFERDWLLTMTLKKM